MTKLEQAARQALDALEDISDHTPIGSGVAHKAITALREALAEPKKPEECANGCPQLQVCDYYQIAEQAEQEPVNKALRIAQEALDMTFTLEDAMAKYPEISYWHNEFLNHNTTAEQTEQKPVASRQIRTPDVCGEVCARAKLCYGCNKDLEEANAKYTKQEPVGYLYDYRQSGEVFSGVFTDDFEMVEFNYGYNIRPLYATPVRTKDLTDDEILKCDERSHGNTEWTKKKAFARAVIAADREKNCGS